MACNIARSPNQASQAASGSAELHCHRDRANGFPQPHSRTHDTAIPNRTLQTRHNEEQHRNSTICKSKGRCKFGGSTCRGPNSFSLRYCLRLLSAQLPSPREAEVGEVEAGAAAVQVPPVAVLLVPVALGLVRPIAGAELAEDRIRAGLLTAVRKIRRRQAAVPILGLLVRQPRRPTPRAGNSTIHETSTIRIIPLIQSGRRVEWDFRPGRLHKREANRTARGRPVLQWFW
jgi:hypothetical protein